ncbi:MAG: CBS domain-containing protein [Sediminicola sp.]
MEIFSHILTNVPVFGLDDDIKEVIRYFKDTTHSHVAISQGEIFVGLLGELDLDIFEAGEKVEAYRLNMEGFSVSSDMMLLDVLEVFARNGANLLPVLDKDGKVLGYYCLTDVVSVFIETPFFTEPGGVLVVAKGIKDYSFSEISQIVESNNSRLMGGFITDIKNDVVQITLKIVGTDMNDIIQTFRRYNYTIMSGSHDDLFLENLKQRSDYLDKYLNV